MPKSLLVFSTVEILSDQKKDRISQELAPIADELGCAATIIDGGNALEMQHDIRPLVDAVLEQTASVSRMIQAIMSLVSAIADDEGVDESMYLDGTPNR